MNLEGKTVWLTGASSGIGKALAFELAEKGVRLVLSSRNEEALEQVRSQLANSEHHLVIPLDLSEPDSLSEKAERVFNQGVSVDILINNGGIGQRGFACETQLDVQRKVMEVNYFGTVTMTQAVLPHMKKQGLA